jgi:3-deoxy-D-manno-octulosonic-acid transferase
MENFQEIAKQFLSAGAALQVEGEKDLASGWMKILADHEASAGMGQKAREVVERHRGATAATLARLVELLEGAAKATR